MRPVSEYKRVHWHECMQKDLRRKSVQTIFHAFLKSSDATVTSNATINEWIHITMGCVSKCRDEDSNS